MEIVFSGVLAVALTWAVVGLLMFCTTPVFIQRGAPASVKVKVVILSALRMPAMWLAGVGVPAVVVATDDMPPEEEARYDDWKQSHCQCEECRRERGE